MSVSNDLLPSKVGGFMDAIFENASYAIDITHALMEYPGGLDQQQREFVQIIERRAVEFVTDFMQKQHLPIQSLRSYLNHDALSPITVIIGYAEYTLMADEGQLHPDYRDAFQQICDCGYVIQDEIRALHEQIWQFMQEMGIPK